MTEKERSTIVDLKKCDFSEINVYFKQKSEERKAMTKEQKQVKYNAVLLFLILRNFKFSVYLCWSIFC